ncbi:retinoid- and fatty-acid binding glycoprotein apolipophorin [Lycorma delicatula]|uniref:retinoid- and fatty-acid binding glycoprotein apolipophorin n=1 Tax=Lycorma delicatula TaxID=130591 RepID=UPI003F5189CF
MKFKRKLLNFSIPVLLLTLSAVNADKKCFSGCHGSSGSLYQYEEGTNYQYKLEGTTTTEVAGSKDVSKITISADVDISAQPQCSYILKVSNINVHGNDGKAHGGFEELQAHPVKFSFHDGHIESEVCTEEGETQSGLNIKRAIISLLQSATHKDAGVTSHYETDVFGTCPTDFEFLKSGNSLKIKKSRNLNLCAHRESLNIPVFSTPYTISSDFQSSPLLISSLSVVQDVQDGVVHSATSEEKYSYQPHASVDSGVLVTVVTKLSFVSQAKGVPIAANVVKPKSIIFDAPHAVSHYSSADTIQKALSKVESSVEPTVQPSAAQDFSDLVDVLSHSKKNDILTVYEGVKSKDTAKKVLLDGIARASTGDSIEVIVELAQKNELSKFQSEVWLASLGFIKHATKESVKSILPLLDIGHRHIYFGVGSLLGRYCSQHDCSNDAVFEEAVTKLAQPLFAGCKVDSREKEIKVIASLKGLHNVHFLTNNIVEKLSQCAADKTVKTKIRVAALETFQSDASKHKLKNTAITILKDLDEDSEVRIKAYLALVECPCQKVADTVKHVIENEKINQVGSFITSHLRNLRASTNPDKAAAKHFLSQILINKNFPVDIRKFSQNHELSYSIDAINLGASGEANVIFSEKSYIPRSYSLNLTSQIFGHAFNVLELNLRTENLDYIFEKYFGPKGYFPSHETEDFINIARKSGSAITDKIVKRFQETVRPKRGARHPRDIHQQTNEFASKVDFGVDSHDHDVDLDLSFKLYGSEVNWISYYGNTNVNPNAIIDKAFDSVDESFEKIKNIDQDFKHHTTFLDAEAIYPTGTGFPLKLNTKGSSAVRVKLDAKIDVPAILRDPKNANIKFQIVPSAAVEVSGQLLIDAFSFESGVKVYGTIHSATGSDLSVRFLEGHGVDVKVGLPVKKQDIISFNSNIIKVIKEKGQQISQVPVKFDTKRQEYNGCFDQLNTFIGLTFCGKLSYPFDNLKLLSPAYGPTNFGVHIEKEDDSLTAYHFKAYYNTKEPNQRTFEILLDTPNSKTNRKLLFVINAGSQPKHLTASLTTPWKVISFDGHITETDLEHTIVAKLLDDANEYYVKAGFYRSGDSNHQTLKPLLEYKFPEFKGKETGLIGVKGNFKGGKSQKAVAVSGLIKLDKQPNSVHRKYTLESVTINIPNKEYKIDGTIAHDTDLLETDLTVAYDKNSVSLKSKLNKEFTDTHKKLKVYIESAFSEVPDFNFVVNWDYSRDQKSLGNVFSLVHGPDSKSTDHTFTINQYVSYHYDNPKSFEFNTKNSLSYPLISLKGTFNAEASPKSLEYELEGGYEKYHLSSSFTGNVNIKVPGDYLVVFKAQVFDKGIEIHGKREIVGENKSKLTNSFELKPGGKYQLNALVTHNFHPDNFHNHIQAEIKVPTDPKNLKLDTGIKNNKNEFSVNFDLTAGGKQFVDFLVEFNKDKPAGNFKASFPNNFDSNGQFTLESGKGVGAFVFNFPKQERKIEGKTDFTHSGDHYKGFAEVFWDAQKDPKKHVKIETDSEFSKEKIDTKNTIIYKNEHKTQINYKGARSSQPTEQSFVSEAEITLPSGRKLASAYNGKYSQQTDDYDGEINFQFTDFSAPGIFAHKLGFNLNAKNVNLNKNSFDGQASIVYNNADGKDANVQAALKKLLTGERWNIVVHGSATGSLTPYPVNLKFDSEVSEQFLNCRLTPENFLPFGTYKLAASAGEVSVDSNGKINQDHINNEVEIKLPADYTITSLKWSSVNQYTPFEKIKTNNAFKWNGDKFFKVIAEGSKEETGVNGKLEWESHLKSARTITGNAYYKPTSDGDQKVNAALTFAYEGKVADVNLKAEYEKKSENIQVQVNGNLPEQGKFDVSVKNKVVNAGKGFQTDVNLVVNDKKITVTNHVVLDKENPLIDLVADHPEGKSRVLFKIEKKGESHFSGESEIKWVGNGGGKFRVDGEAKFDSPDDFFFKFNVDSPKLKLEKYHFDITNKPTKTAGKKIIFTAKTATRVLFAGSTTFNLKEESNSKTIEGSGSIKIGEKTYPLNFKYVQQKLTEANNGEDGNEVKATVKFGKNQHDFLIKITTNTFLIRRSFSWDTGETASAEISSTIKKYSIAEYDYEFHLILDLSTFVADVDDISLKITTKRNGFIFDHNFELEKKPDTKINYQLYVHENEAGAVLTLPKRVVAAEAKYEIPKNKKNGILLAEASLWLDKQKSPSEKTSVSVNADINKIGEGGSFSGEVRASHPGLGKDLVVKGHITVLQQWSKVVDAKVDLDVFAKKEQKIIVEYKFIRNVEKEGYNLRESLHIKGGSIDVEYKQILVATKPHLNYNLVFSYTGVNKAKKESKFSVDLTSTKGEMLFKIPEGTLYLVRTKIKGHLSNHLIIETDYEFLGEKYAESVEIKNQNNLKYAFIYDKGGKEKKLSADFGFAIGQVADLSASFDGKELSFVQVALDDGNFLKSKYSYNTDSFKEFITFAKEDYINLVKKYSKVFQDALNRITKDVTHHVEKIQKSLPDFGPVVKTYTEQIQALKQEVVSEKSIQEAADYIKGTLGIILQQVVTVLEEIAKASESFVTLFNEVTSKFNEAIKNLTPKITESYEKISKVLINLFEESLKFSVEGVNFILDKIKEHEEEIQIIVSATAEIFSEIGKLTIKTYLHLKGQIYEFVDLFVEQVKALPVFGMIKEKFDELKSFEIPETAWADYHNFVDTVKDALPTPELSQFFSSVAASIEKILRHKPLNPDHVNTFLNEFIAAVKSIFRFIQQHVPQEKFVKPSIVPLPTFTLWKLPKGALRLSPIAWLQSPDLPSVSDIYYTYRPTLNPIDYIPPYRASAYLIHSTEFFTFDKRHISFKGNCLYLLAHDFVDGNFTIAAQIDDGIVKSIIISDKKDNIEFKSDGTVHVNGAPSEFPVSLDELKAWRRYPTVNAFSKAGILIHCTTNLDFCTFRVSGFYFGKTRGLLGTINNEPYNDLTLPNGKVASTPTECANAYKLSSCGDVAATPETHAHQTSYCTGFFSSESVFKTCYPFVNPFHYRHACNILAAEATDKKAIACKVANAYYAACGNSDVSVSVPSECIQCSVDGKTLEEGETATVKTPNKKADIVLVVEQVEQNEDVFKLLVTPLIGQLTKNLGAQGINDVHFSLIGFGAPGMKWPQHYTTNGKIDFNGKSTIYFSKKAAPATPENSNDFIEKIKYYKHQFDLEIGNTQKVIAYTEAFNYPFRPDAAKAVIGVLGGPCERAPVPILQYSRLLKNLVHKEKTGIQFHLITHLNNLQPTTKDAKHHLTDIVGFNKDEVYTLNSRKKPSESYSPSSITYDSDICATTVTLADGVVFNAANFVNGKTDAKKHFIHDVSTILTENLAGKQQTLECTCVESEGLPKTDCFVEDTSEREILQKQVKGVKG